MNGFAATSTLTDERPIVSITDDYRREREASERAGKTKILIGRINIMNIGNDTRPLFRASPSTTMPPR
jgi:hypothetical protein